jgi:glycosyltransferase involved in cell wall biosynthesis
MFVSVIIPVYNDASRAEMVIRALAGQSYPRSAYEVVVVDNRSTDRTLEVVRKFERQQSDLVRAVCENGVQSSYAARNKGVTASRGEILAFTDSDCIPERDWIERGVAGLQKESVKCGGGKVRFFFKSERPNIYEYFDAARKLNQKSHIEKAGFAATANFFVRRELFDQYGLFRSDLISGGDYEFGRRLTRRGEKIVYIPSAVVHHPARANLRSILKKSRRVAEGQRQLEKEGLLEHGKISLPKLLPKLSFPISVDLKKSFSVADKVRLLATYNFILWMNFFIRIR